MRVLTFVLLTCALSCSSSTGVEIGGVVASARHGEIKIINLTDKPVYTLVIGRNSSVLALIALCTNPQTCVALEPGGSKREPYPPPFGGRKETEAVVHWWRIVPNGSGGFKPDSVRVGFVRLR